MTEARDRRSGYAMPEIGVLREQIARLIADAERDDDLLDQLPLDGGLTPRLEDGGEDERLRREIAEIASYAAEIQWAYASVAEIARTLQHAIQQTITATEQDAAAEAAERVEALAMEALPQALHQLDRLPAPPERVIQALGFGTVRR